MSNSPFEEGKLVWGPEALGQVLQSGSDYESGFQVTSEKEREKCSCEKEVEGQYPQLYQSGIEIVRVKAHFCMFTFVWQGPQRRGPRRCPPRTVTRRGLTSVESPLGNLTEARADPGFFTEPAAFAICGYLRKKRKT